MKTIAAQGRVLIVDSDPLVTSSFADLLRSEGLHVESYHDGQTALQRIQEEHFDVLLADLNPTGISGIELLRACKQMDPAPIPILFTGWGTIENAVEAMREGAFEFLEKPLVEDQMILTVRRALEQRAILQENEDLRQRLDHQFSFAEMIGRDHKMQKMFQLAQTVAESKTTVLITGESGTGKTMIARSIHHNSPRKAGPFIEVNCGGLPETLLESELFGSVKGAYTGAIKDKEGKFEAAEGGTIFLDEIGTASQALQVKLLRVLQDRVFERVGDTQTKTADVRVILATNRDLATEVREGRFREDLFYRIHVITLEVPPLRERIADVPLLAEHFLEIYSQENKRKIKKFTREAMDLLVSYHWPGNVRELQNALERAVVLCRGSKISPEDLPPSLQEQKVHHTQPATNLEIQSLKKALEVPEKQIIETALLRFHGNRQKTAEALEVNRTTLFNKMRKYGLMDQPFA